MLEDKLCNKERPSNRSFLLHIFSFTGVFMLEFFDNKNFNENNELNNNDKRIEMLDISNLSEDNLNALLDEGFRDIEEGNYQTVEDAFKSIYD